MNRSDIIVRKFQWSRSQQDHIWSDEHFGGHISQIVCGNFQIYDFGTVLDMINSLHFQVRRSDQGRDETNVVKKSLVCREPFLRRHTG